MRSLVAPVERVLLLLVHSTAFLGVQGVAEESSQAHEVSDRVFVNSAFDQFCQEFLIFDLNAQKPSRNVPCVSALVPMSIFKVFR